MKEIKGYTPAPWTITVFTVKKSNGMKITQQRPVAAGDWETIDESYRADAELIALAPTMYEQLSAIRSLLSKEYPDGGEWLKREIEKLLSRGSVR